MITNFTATKSNRQYDKHKHKHKQNTNTNKTQQHNSQKIYWNKCGRIISGWTVLPRYPLNHTHTHSCFSHPTLTAYCNLPPSNLAPKLVSLLWAAPSTGLQEPENLHLESASMITMKTLLPRSQISLNPRSRRYCRRQVQVTNLLVNKLRTYNILVDPYVRGQSTISGLGSIPSWHNSMKTWRMRRK